MGTCFIRVDPVFDLDSFVLEVGYEEGDVIIEDALKYLKELITDSFEKKGLDTSIIPEDLGDFEEWVTSVSDSLDKYLTYYIDSAVSDNPSEAILLGWWDIYEEEIYKEMESVIDRIVERSRTLDDLVSGLRDTPEFADARIVYDYSYDDAEYEAKQIVKDVIGYWKERMK